MSSEWQSYLLSDLFDLINGYAFKGSEFITAGVPVIKIKNVKPNNLLLGDLAFVDSEVANKRPDKELKRGDILITMSGNRMDGSRDTWVGKVAYFDIPGRYMLNQRVGVLRPKSGVAVDRKCCSYFLSSDDFQDFFIAVATSSGGQANLSPSQILGEKISLPPLGEQKQISSMLTTIDDRITLLRETNATLEAIAQAIFKSWFVDFDPVRAKQEGRAPEGMDEATAVLFPDSFEESEVGLVPRGWGQSSIGQLCSLTKGCSYKGDGLSEGQGAYMFNLGCFNAPRIFATEKIKRYTGEYKERHMVSAGDLILANTDMTQERAILGRPLLIPEGYSPGFISHHVFKATPKAGGDSLSLQLYLYFSFLQAAFRERAVGYATGTTVLGLPKDALEKHLLILPPEAIRELFSQTVKPMIDQIARNIDLAKTLATLRDTLLPRLISGQLRLPESEAMIQGAAA